MSTYPPYDDSSSPTPLYDQSGDAPEFGTDAAGATNGNSGKSDAAKEQAGKVASDAQDATKHVAGVTKDQAGQVASEAKSQAKDLFAQTTSELKDQAGVQQQKVADGLRSVSGELSSMADNADGSGVATELVRNLSGRAGSVASWLDGRDPGSLLDEVKHFAARKPGTFIAIAAGAGILAGRLAKSLAADAKRDAGTATSSASHPAPATTDAPSTSRNAEPPFRTEAAFADRSETIGASDETYADEPTFEKLLGDAALPGQHTADGDRS